MRSLTCGFGGWLVLVACAVSTAAAQQDPAAMDLGGKFEMRAPEGWMRQQPRTSIVEYEFAVPKAKDDAADGRMTIMRAGGGVEANIDRWYTQFTQPDGGSTRDRGKVKKITVAGEEVHLVDLSGTYKDQRGPMAPAVERPDYRMLGAILATKNAGTFYIKLYGPKKTIADNEGAFVKMIEGLAKK
jgi:hypothetical protein